MLTSAFLVVALAALPKGDYSIQDLGTLGGDFTFASGINSAGVVVGASATIGGDQASDHAFIWQDGKMIDLGNLFPGARSYASDVNEAGCIAGGSQADAAERWHAVRWVNGKIVDLHPGGDLGQTWGYGLNDACDVVGSGWTGVSPQRAYLWPSGGSITPLPSLSGPTPAGSHDNASDINNMGFIVGMSEVAPLPAPLHAVFWAQGPMGYEVYDLHGTLPYPSSYAAGINEHGTFVGVTAADDGGGKKVDAGGAPTTLPFLNDGTAHILGSPNGAAYAANNLGQAVGSINVGGQQRAAIFRGGIEIDLNTLIDEGTPWTLTHAADINDRGQIVGTGFVGGQPRGYILTPRDQDADGLLDSWESQGGGIDADGDDVPDLDLYALGARPDHKDLFVEVDAMAVVTPSQAAIDKVVDAFADAPLANPDGNDGIALHVQIDETGLPDAAWDIISTWNWQQFDAFKAARWGTVAQRAAPDAAVVLAAKRLAYRYCVFAQQIHATDISGVAELPGNDFIVSLGLWANHSNVDVQAGTFMHELGHTLGLRHGGNDHKNFKPNFVSCMNYMWQVPELWSAAFWKLDYSREKLPTLFEGGLSEPDGIGSSDSSYQGVQVIHGSAAPGDPFAYAIASITPPGESIDWNDDGDADDLSLAVDLNRCYPNLPASPGEVLAGHEEWPAIGYALQGGPDFQDGVHAPPGEEVELTYEMYLIMNAVPPPPPACPADVTADGAVGIADLLALLAAWGPCPPPCAADIDGNGDAGIADLLTLLGAWGPCP